MSTAKTLPASHIRSPRVYGNARTLLQVFLYQLFSLGTYQFFWFLRNYRHFQVQKEMRLSPIGHTLGLVGFTIGLPLGLNRLIARMPEVGGQVGILLELAVPLSAATALCLFYYRQFTLITQLAGDLGFRERYAPHRLAWTMATVPIILYLWMRMFLDDGGTVFDWLIIYMGLFFTAGLTAWAMVRAQRVLNLTWKSHKKRTYGDSESTPAFFVDGIVLVVVLLVSLAAWCFFGFLFTEAAGLTHVIES